ncbi:MAG: glycosyltransferase, partial [Coriobacteriia bacterium]|nr:glycosyltransferase [Coriobacteriia bacterium]
MGLAGLIFTRQFPNREQPHRGTFVVEQMLATSEDVSWRAIAPVPWVPKALSRVMDRPFVKGPDTLHGVHVDRPRYVVLPRRALYGSVAGSMARASRKAFADVVSRHAPAFVHAHELYPSGLAAARLAGSAGLPLVVSVHGSDLYSNLVRAKWRDALREVVHSASAIV